MSCDVSLSLCPLCRVVLKIGFSFLPSFRLSAPLPCPPPRAPSVPSAAPAPSVASCLSLPLATATALRAAPAAFLKTQVFVERESERASEQAARRRRRQSSFGEKPLIEEGKNEAKGERKEGSAALRCAAHFRDGWFDFSLLPNKKTKPHLLAGRHGMAVPA